MSPRPRPGRPGAPARMRWPQRGKGQLGQGQAQERDEGRPARSASCQGRVGELLPVVRASSACCWARAVGCSDSSRPRTSGTTVRASRARARIGSGIWLMIAPPARLRRRRGSATWPTTASRRSHRHRRFGSGQLAEPRCASAGRRPPVRRTRSPSATSSAMPEGGRGGPLPARALQLGRVEVGSSTLIRSSKRRVGGEQRADRAPAPNSMWPTSSRFGLSQLRARLQAADLLQRAGDAAGLPGELHRRGVGQVLALPGHRGLDEPADEHPDPAGHEQRDADERQRVAAGLLVPAASGAGQKAARAAGSGR